jgi:hypothetical protein
MENILYKDLEELKDYTQGICRGKSKMLKLSNNQNYKNIFIEMQQR